jgi:hypothetical protein
VEAKDYERRVGLPFHPVYFGLVEKLGAHVGNLGPVCRVSNIHLETAILDIKHKFDIRSDSAKFPELDLANLIGTVF